MPRDRSLILFGENKERFSLGSESPKKKKKGRETSEILKATRLTVKHL